MNEPLWLSRVTPKRRQDVAQILAEIAPKAASDGFRTAQHHKLLWHVFSDSPERTRDFLWTEDERGRFITLSKRRPLDEPALFDVETKEFDPSLSPGDRLTFRLRCNATRARKSAADPSARGKREDVVKASIDATAPNERASARDVIVGREGLRWLRAQGERSGFALLEGPTPDRSAETPKDQRSWSAHVSSYRILRIPRGSRRSNDDAVFGVFEFEGVLQVVDPAVFLDRLSTGFGRGKAFGLGLMLIRRASRR